MAADPGITRRSLLKGGAALGAGLALTSAPFTSRPVSSLESTSPPRRRRGGRRPNFVVVLVDDLDDVVSPYWDAMPRARELFKDRGLRFSNSFTPAPVCCPSRAVTLTGMYPHDNGVMSGTPPDGGYATFAKNGSEQRTVSVRLQDAGYTTAFIGKYLNGYEKDPALVPPGWDEWFGLAGTFLDGYAYTANHNGQMESFGKDARDYQTDVLARTALAFLDDAERGTDPFLLFVAPSAPHAPIAPAQRHAHHRYSTARLPRRPNFNEADVSDKPLWIREGMPQLDTQAIDLETMEYRNGMGALLAVDDMIDRIVTRLRQQGKLDDTVFVFASDNGMSRGSHRLHGKTVPYEESLRVPLAFAGAGVRHGVDGRFVTNLDYAPTLLELAGVTIPDDIAGRSLAPILAGSKTPSWRTDIFAEFNGTYGLFPVDTRGDVESYVQRKLPVPYPPTYRALRTRRWLYVEWYGGSDHDYELYDLDRDPYQMSNLLGTHSGAARHAGTAGALQQRLAELGSCAGTSCRT